jgi:hypothetical protein
MPYTTARMHKKVVIIIAIAVGVLITVSGVVGTILVLNRDTTTPPTTSTIEINDSEQESQTTPDLSVDLGACTIVSYYTISEALALYIPEVREANNRGFGYEENGDRSQSCVYAFSAKNNLYNRFTLTVTEFLNETNKNNVILAHKDDTIVAGLGEKAYSATNTEAKQTSYSLFMIKDMKLYTFVILQGAVDQFTETSAHEALATIAKTVQ